LVACSGGCGEGECGVSVGEVALPGEFPVRDDESGVLVEQLADVLGGLALGAAFAAEGAEGGGVAAALGGEMSTEADHVNPAA
jgi:hypothetical protein